MGQPHCTTLKEVGGITIAHKLETAGRPDMPGSAIASGYIDFVLSPEDIANEIVRIAHEEVSELPPAKKKAHPSVPRPLLSAGG